jgi:hypothetical protein
MGHQLTRGYRREGKTVEDSGDEVCRRGDYIMDQ